MIPVAEIFGPTIQGEGPHVGMQTLFVRVAGCDFKCAWCDSKFAWKIDDSIIRYGTKELADILVQECNNSKCRNVVLTGGNPCLYDFKQVIDILHNNNITVDIETQGSKMPDWLLDVDLLVISPKAPSSKQSDVYKTVNEYMNMKLLSSIRQKVAIKIPVFNEEDFEFAMKYYALVDYYREKGVDIDLYLSVGNTNTTEAGDISKRVLSDYEKLINMIVNSYMERVFILPQVHTLVWGNKQGV